MWKGGYERLPGGAALSDSGTDHRLIEMRAYPLLCESRDLSDGSMLTNRSLGNALAEYLVRRLQAGRR